MSSKKKIIIGTRGSELALWQSTWVAKELQRLHPLLTIETTVIKTTGDKILDSPFQKLAIRVYSQKRLRMRFLRKRSTLPSTA